ncbi:dTDP-4-dehydrorhamnose 3,5-epimerase [Flavobacterium sp. J372]|uniref:dTDP-4-dehydrorhamnose 3,5-epimerase n=1 Tax=Flavobacterium sp. J372 TaxID=2898436 RepID=UPI002150A00D|nr:dTDP-4-dehydrorhamnose 3,5-epimerase [Flavobacterium sp. J372]MCR5861164.1 dTDP-4-dehydrorhamnose 3,5-epimerase [Flavobacterium sp. J372]
MNVIATELEGCLIIEPKVFYDERGYFMETFNESAFEANTGIKAHFVQDNQSKSTRGVLRGLHYQTGAYAQAKLVRVIEGEVLDVVVDIRPESKTYGQHISVLLSSENNKQFFIPRGFAHGFVVLSDTATFFYKCDNIYNKDSEGGIAYNDDSLKIDWQLEDEILIISEKDKYLPELQNSLKIW